MSKLKKVLLMCTAYVLVAALAIGGTIAYLQDDDSDVNVMTLGNVSIAQHEYERATNADGSYKTDTIDGVTSYVLKDFTQGKPLLPIVGDPNEPGNSPAYAGFDNTIVRMTQVDSYGGMQVFAGKNAQDKFVTVENTGKNDAYIRTLVAIECGTGNPALIGTGDRCVAADQAASSTMPWIEYEIGKIVIDNNTYLLFEYVYRGASDVNRHVNGILPAGDTTYPNLCQVYLKHNATNEDMVAIDGNGNGTLDILVLSQAVQVDGFADAETALNAGFGDITATNHPWANTIVADEVGITEAGTYDLNGDVYTIDSAYFHTQKVTAPVTINGNGATVEGVATSVDAFQWEGGTIPAMSAIFSSADGSKVTVNDLTFTGTMSAVSLGHYVNSSSNWYNTEFNNVDIVNTEVVSFSAGISPAACVYGTAVLNNCNVYGTTLSELDTDPMWPVYDIAAVNYSDLTVNNSNIGSLYMWNQAKVTVADGSDVETVIVRGNMNTSKYGLTIEAGATVGAIDLSAIANKTKINITIEDGATVGKIIANGVEYATITDWQNA
ncbi:MAG: hypothetical protein IJZ03_07490 [Clostridia bacterium]|nr:hypothetical protein [Clostridia bacterium]